MIYNATIGLKSKNNISYAFRERSILALGAIAVGSYEYLKPHLSIILSYILEELQNPNKLIRAITCWTLSR